MLNNSITLKYIEYIEQLTSSLPSLNERYTKIKELCETYFQEVNQQLPSFLLEKLGTWYISEIYSDKRTNKVSVDEFPCLSESQLLRRKRKVVNIQDEFILDIIDYHNKNNGIIISKEKIENR